MNGYLIISDEYYFQEIKISQQIIQYTYLQMSEILEFEKDLVRRKRRIQKIEEEQNFESPSKRIKEKGEEYEKELYTQLNNAQMKPVKTTIPDRGIDMIGEYKGITIWAQAKNHETKIGAKDVQAFIGAISNKKHSIGVIVSKNGFTQNAEVEAKAAPITLILTDIPNLIKMIQDEINGMQEKMKTRIEIIGESAEITQINQGNTRETSIKKAKKVIIYQ
jgi:predicted helicase